jgi:SSS family solute:Na+ symporter
MKLELLLSLAGYLSLLLAAGLLFRRRSDGLDSFFLASRRVGAFRITFSLCAAWIGAASLLVSTDEACRDGLSAYWIIGLPAVVTLLLFLPLAGAIRKLGGATISDVMEARYGRAARPLTTLLIVWYMVVLAASQMVAAGDFLKVFLGTSYTASLALAAAVVLAYLAAGGFPSLVRTHTLQFFLLVAGILALSVSLGLRSSWKDVVSLAARQGRAGYLNVLAHADRNPLIALSFVLAWLISPIAWQRIQAARSAGSARKGVAGAALMLGLFYAGIVVAGMFFLPLFPGGKGAGPVVSEYIAFRAGPALGGLIFITVLAAILSTMAAAVNAGAFSLSRDLLRYGAGREEGKPGVGLGRTATLIIGAAAFLVATRFEDILTTLGLASKIMAEGLFLPGLAAVLIKRRAPLAGLLSLVAGGGYALACFFAEARILPFAVPPWPLSLIPGLGLGTGGFVLGLAAGRLGKSRAARRPE